jgi:ATP-dependent Clp protease protease subunit
MSIYVIEEVNGEEKGYDLASRMLKDRIIFINGEFNDKMADSVVAQLLFLESQSSEKDISIYINSPGGLVTSMYAIYDTMCYIRPDVATIGYGQVCSAGSFILAAGTKGKRYALKNTDIMIHELSGGHSGMFHDMKVAYEKTKRLHDKMAKQYSKVTGQSIKKIREDMEIDNWLTADEAKAYGLIDHVEEKRPR